MLNVIPMVPTKKVVVEYTQKEMRKKFRLFTTKNRQKKTVMQEMRGKKTIRHMEDTQTEVSSSLSGITSNINGLNSSLKRQRLAGWLKTCDPKKNEILPFATSWMELENIMPNEISRTERQHGIIYM